MGAILKRRKEMNNAERTERIIMHLRKNKKYRVFAYNVYFILWNSIVLSPILIMLLVFLETKDVQNLGLCMIVATACGALLAICFLIMRCKKRINNSKMLIEANINREEMFVWPPGRTIFTMATYFFTVYYVEGMRTYKFRCKVKDDQLDLYRIFVKLEEEGKYPKMKILVNSQNYKDYEALGYEFIEDTLKLNEQLVNEELDDYYNTSEKWKYIK